MSHRLAKSAVNVLKQAALSASLALSVVCPAQALTFNYSFLTDTGYSGNGQFRYTGSPATVSAAGAGPVAPLQFLSLAVFSPVPSLLDSGAPVVGGVSSDPYFRLEFDALTETIGVLDANTGSSGHDPYYFISNRVDTSGGLLPSPGSDFYLFAFSPGTYTYLGSTSSIPTSEVPEPFSMGLWALAAMLVGGVARTRPGGPRPSSTCGRARRRCAK